MIKFKLHIRLAERRLTQTELADAIGVSQPTISKYYNDSQRVINTEHLDKICKFFNCDLSEILEYVPDEQH